MFDWLTADAAGDLASGVMITVALTIITSPTSLLLGMAIGAGRTSPRRRLRVPAGVFVEAFRNVPALILIIFWAFAVPNLFAADVRRQLFFDNPLIDGLGAVTGLALPYHAAAACLALTLNTSAHIAEIFRGGIAAVPAEQVESSRLLGGTRSVVFRTVIAPSAIRTSFPAISTRLVHNMKNTALASFVAVPELFSEIQGAINKTFLASQYLTLAAVLYLVLSAAMSVGLGAVDRRLNRWRPPTVVGGGAVSSWIGRS